MPEYGKIRSVKIFILARYAVYARHIKQIIANKLSCHKSIPRQAVIQSKAILKLWAKFI